MTAQLESGFAFALTNPGAEKALKFEVGMTHPEWKLSYQRRGFVTFKAPSEDQPFTLDLLSVPFAFARRLGLSVGKFESKEEALAKLKSMIGDSAVIQEARFFERKMEGIQSSIGTVKIGDLLGDIVELGEDEFWAGIHRHAEFLSPFPAGDPGIEMPTDSPSRAWLKLEEAVRFFGLNFSKKDIVVEVGAAPGGVVLALLNRGASVIGVDPAKMAEVVMASAISERENTPKDRPWFYHCQKPASLVSKRDLGADPTWFMSDMNQSPEVVLTECARFCRMAPSIHGALMTLKLTDLLDVARKDAWFQTLRDMGFKTVRLQQFSAHHRELALLALK